MNGEVYTQQEFLDKFKQKHPSYGNAVIQGLTTDDELFKKIIAKYPSYLEHIKPQEEIQAGIKPPDIVEPEYPERPEYEPPPVRGAGWQPSTKEPVKEPNRVSRILASVRYEEPEPTKPEIIKTEHEKPSARAAGWQLPVDPGIIPKPTEKLLEPITDRPESWAAKTNREDRIKEIETGVEDYKGLVKQIDTASENLEKYDKYIEGGNFIGTEEQYGEYKEEFDSYNKLVQLQKPDEVNKLIEEYNQLAEQEPSVPISPTYQIGEEIEGKNLTPADVGKAQGELELMKYADELRERPKETVQRIQTTVDSFIEKTPVGVLMRLTSKTPGYIKVRKDILKEKYPVESQVGSMLGRLSSLVAAQPAGSAMTKFADYWLAPLELGHPLAFRFIPQILGTSTTWGLAGLMEEAARQRGSGEKFDPEELIKVTAAESAFGAMWGGTLAIPNRIARISAAAIGRGAWTTGRKLIEDHNIDKNDLIEIALESAMSAALASIGAKKAEQLYKIRRDNYIEMKKLEIKRTSLNVGKLTQHQKAGLASYKSLSNDYLMFSKSPAITEVYRNLPPNFVPAKPHHQVNYIRRFIKSREMNNTIAKAFEDANMYWQSVFPNINISKTITPKDIQNVDINQNAQTGKYSLSVSDKSGIVKTKEYDTYEEAQAIAVPLAKEVAEAQKHAGVEKTPLKEPAKPPIAAIEKPKVEQKAVVGGKVLVDKEVEPETIPKELEPLVKEARKYKSAEEFIDAQPKLYHGSTRNFKSEDIEEGAGNYRRGIYLNEEVSVARDYGKNIHKYIINPKAKILNLSSGKATLDFILQEGILERDDISVDLENYILEGRIFQYDPYNRQGIVDDIIATAQEKGYDVVHLFDDLGGGSNNIATVVINKDVLKTELQLKSFYDQATKEVEPTKVPVAEKQPWEMTVKELAEQEAGWYKGKQYLIPKDKFKTLGLEAAFVKKGNDYYYVLASGDVGGKLEKELYDSKIKQSLESHKYYIQKALSEGKTPYEGWEKDYPDLAKPTEKVEPTEKGIVKEPISEFKSRIIEANRIGYTATKPVLYKYIKEEPAKISEMVFKSLNNVITGRPIGVKHFIPKKAYLKTRTAEKKLAVYNFLDNFGIRGAYESQDDYTKRILAKYPRLGKHTKKIKDYVNQIFKEGKDKALSDARREGFISPPVGKEGEILPDYKRTTYPVRPEEPTISTVKEPSKSRGTGKIRIPSKALEGEGFPALKAIFGAKVARMSESGAIIKDYGQIKGVTVGGKTILDIESKRTNYDTTVPEAYKISTGKDASFDEILDEAHNEIDRFERGEISKTGKILKEKLSAKELFEAEEWGKSEEVRIKEAVTEVGGLNPVISESGKTVKFEVPKIGIKTVMRTKDIHYDDVAERIDKRLREHEIPEEQLELLNKKKELRQRIHAFVSVKGMTDTQLRDIIKKRTLYKNAEGEDVGYRHLTNKKITVEQLEKILKSVKVQRPKRIGYKRVITLKTENKIQSLKDNLTKQNSMTDEYFQNILQKEVHGKEPKYISKNLFITESEGKSIVDRMHDESEIINQNESFNRAIKKKPEIEEQVRLLTDKILNKKKRDPHSLESIRHYCQQSEIVTGSPIFTAYQELIDKHLEILNRHGKKWEEISNCTDDFKVISGDESSIERVREYIASKSHLKRKPKKPKNLTEGELILAKKIESILKDYEHKARTAKFFNYRFYDQPIPDYDRYKKEIDKAVDVYDSKGREALIEYLKTQDWGIIHSGYEPLQVAAPKIKTYEIPPGGLGKGHIKIRSDIEYHKQERNILQRLNSYMKQIDMLYELQPKIRAFIRLYDDNFDKFKNSNKVKNDVELFLKNVKRYNIQGGFFEKILARLYSQAMRVIIMPSPVLSFRNLFQNAAFEHDKSILIDPRNKKLTNEDIKYLESYCLQTRQIIEEYFMIGEKPLPGLAFLTNIVNKVKIYPYSDLANRYWSFWAKKNQVDRALKKPKSITGFMKNAKFEDISELEQKRALGILARDGEDAASRYIARVHVDDIHFLYERAQRSPAEMSPLGRVMGNLMLFPRAYGEKLAKAASKVINKKASFSKRYRGLKILFSVIAGGMIAGEIYKKITGRTRNPYNPLQTLSYEPGGLAWGTVEIAGDIYSSMLHALMGDDRALNELTTAIPKAADMFIPFYAYSIRAIEASVDKKNLDRLALRKIRELIDNEYNVRGGAYEIERNALEKWQYFISGAGVDYKIQESKKQKKPVKFEPYEEIEK